MPPDDPATDNSEPESVAAFRGHGWFNIWGILLAIFLCLVALCIYWLVRLGPAEAFDDNQFGYAGILAVITGICLIGRWSVTGLLLGSSLDRRNLRLLANQRMGWYRRTRL